MADTKDIQAEFKVIADADAAINSYLYDHEDAIVTDDRAKTYPLFLLYKNFPFRYDQFSWHKRTYSMTIGIFDDWNIAEQKDKPIDEKYSDIENTMEQYLREFISRSLGETVLITTPQDWQIPTPELITVEKVDSFVTDKLVGLKATFELIVNNDCDTGTFVY